MSNTYGPALMAYVDAELAARRVAPTAFATQHGIAPSQFGRWRSGQHVPGIDAVVNLALALGIPPIELLALTIGAVEPGAEGAPAQSQPPTIDAAIALDPGLSDDLRRSLADIVAAMRRFQAGDSDEVTTTNRRTPKQNRPK